MMLASELRTADRHKWALYMGANGHDMGPTYLEQLAYTVDQIRSHYQAREYGQANLLQKEFANRVARLGTDPDVEPELARSIEHQTIELWKSVWKLADNEVTTKVVIEHNAAAIADSERLLERNKPGRSISDDQRDEILAVNEWAKTLPGSERLGPMRDAAFLGIADGAKAAQTYFNANPKRFSWASDMVEAGRGMEMVAGILREPRSWLAAHRASFRRAEELPAAYEAYRGAYTLAVGRFVLERQRRLASGSAQAKTRRKKATPVGRGE
jgi:hypothetical protein